MAERVAADVIEAIAARIDRDLRAASNAERAAAERRYLKSGLEFLGTGVPALRAVVKAARKAQPNLDHDAISMLVQTLWEMPIYERRLAAVEVLIAYERALEPAEMPLVERLLREAGTWAIVDPLATGVASALVQRHPELTGALDRWATDADFWVRRAALLALLPPLRQGRGDFARFGRYADTMLTEREFFIRKAIGWVLREVGKRQPTLVAEWLLPRAGRASGVTTREAVRYLSPEQRDEILRAYQARHAK